MEYKFTIPGRLDGLNDYTAANRTNPRKGGRMKKKSEDSIIWYIRQQLPGVHITDPVLIYYQFYEKTVAGIMITFCPAPPSSCRTA